MDIQFIYTNKGDPKYGSCLLQASGADKDIIVKKKMKKKKDQQACKQIDRSTRFLFRKGSLGKL